MGRKDEVKGIIRSLLPNLGQIMREDNRRGKQAIRSAFTALFRPQLLPHPPLSPVVPLCRRGLLAVEEPLSQLDVGGGAKDVGGQQAGNNYSKLGNLS